MHEYVCTLCERISSTSSEIKSVERSELLRNVYEFTTLHYLV